MCRAPDAEARAAQHSLIKSHKHPRTQRSAPHRFCRNKVVLIILILQLKQQRLQLSNSL